MAKGPRWTAEDRKRLWKMVQEGIPEQEIREAFSYQDAKGRMRIMSSSEFALQLKRAMIEAGQLKQRSSRNKRRTRHVYKVTNTGRLTISDFAAITGAKPGDTFVLEPPRGRSKAWRLVPKE